MPEYFSTREIIIFFFYYPARHKAFDDFLSHDYSEFDATNKIKQFRGKLGNRSVFKLVVFY
jgi:hypothetical protein